MEPLTVIVLLVLWFWPRAPTVYGEPGPVDRPEDDVNDSEYLGKVDELISQTPRAQRFWQITAGGQTASTMATAVLLPYGADTSANRLRLIKCMTMVPWNRARYSATHEAKTWGTFYDVDGLNLSAAWLPRHAPAAQLLASRESPPRTIDETGKGAGGYYGLLWIPKITISAGQLVCSPEQEGPPAWLLAAIGGS